MKFERDFNLIIFAPPTDMIELLVALLEMVKRHENKIINELSRGKEKTDIFKEVKGMKCSGGSCGFYLKELNEIYKYSVGDVVGFLKKGDGGGKALRVFVVAGFLGEKVDKCSLSMLFVKSYFDKTLHFYLLFGRNRRRGDTHKPRPSSLRRFWVEGVVMVPEKAGGVDVSMMTLEIKKEKGWKETLSQNCCVPFSLPRIGVWNVHRDLGIRMRIVSHTDGAGTSFQPESFILSSDKGEGYFEDLVRDMLERCRALKVDILVMPELSVPESLLNVLKKQLHVGAGSQIKLGDGALFPEFVFAGSFHYGNGRVNRSYVLDGSGKNIQVKIDLPPTSGMNIAERTEKRSWSHDKIDRYVIIDPAKNIRRCESGLDITSTGRSSTACCLDSKTGANSEGKGMDCYEPMEVGESFKVVSTRFGNISLGVCIDFINKIDRICSSVTGPWLEWFFISAATESLSVFKTQCERVTAGGSAVIIANACWLLDCSGAWEKGAETGCCLGMTPQRPEDAKDAYRWYFGGGLSSGGQPSSSPVEPWGKILPPKAWRPSSDDRQGKVSYECIKECKKCLWIFSKQQ